MIDALLQFGVAGLMGALWVWERRYSRQREEQLTQSHRGLMRQTEQLQSLVRLVRLNTRAMVNAERTSESICELLKGINDELRKNKNKRGAA